MKNLEEMLEYNVLLKHLDQCSGRVAKLSPIAATVERKLHIDNSDDSYLLRLKQPFHRRVGLRNRLVKYLAVSARWKGQLIESVLLGRVDMVPVNLFFIIKEDLIINEGSPDKYFEIFAIGTIHRENQGF